MADMRLPFAIRPATESDASHYARYGVGGYYSVEGDTELARIPASRLVPGTIVRVESTGKYWLFGDPGAWSEVIIPGVTEWENLGSLITEISENYVYIKETDPGEVTDDDILLDLDVYSKSEVDSLLAAKADYTSEYFMVLPGSRPVGSEVTIKFYGRSEVGLFSLNDADFKEKHLSVTWRAYSESGTETGKRVGITKLTSDGLLTVTPPDGTRYMKVFFESPVTSDVVITRDTGEITFIRDGRDMKYTDLTASQISALKEPATSAAFRVNTEWESLKTEIQGLRGALTSLKSEWTGLVGITMSATAGPFEILTKEEYEGLPVKEPKYYYVSLTPTDKATGKLWRVYMGETPFLEYLTGRGFGFYRENPDQYASVSGASGLIITTSDPGSLVGTVTDAGVLILCNNGED